MATTRVRKEAVWHGFSSSFDELQALQDQLREIEVRREGVTQQIEAKKRDIEHACGLAWEEIQTTLVVGTSRNGSTSKSDRRGSMTTAHKEGTIRDWVLRAIAHYEDDNPQSRIDEGSIRIYINAEAPVFLDDRSPNAIFSALNGLKSKGLVITVPGRGNNHGRSQYSLTAQGRAALK